MRDEKTANVCSGSFDRRDNPLASDLALELLASGATTRPVEIVIAVLSSHRRGASINAAAKGSGINYRTAERIVEAAAEHQHQQLMAVG